MFNKLIETLLGREVMKVIFCGKELEQADFMRLIEIVKPAVCEVVVHHAKGGVPDEEVTKHAKTTAEAIVSALSFTTKN
ncbi:hypothetical protein QOM18_05785 [Serratia marcescens]|uniref:hypothetical protein n=1 Tax=Serratia marcescens TaxID=615 RepID=UPI0024C4AEB3|nr:hypothetical protein [Serratia marcescens]MDK1707815.1 hypothetical protein [Serratia marcescens]